MPQLPDNPNIRKGQFLYKDTRTQKKYVARLKKRIEEGFYCSDTILEKIVEEIAPVFSENATPDSSW